MQYNDASGTIIRMTNKIGFVLLTMVLLSACSPETVPTLSPTLAESPTWTMQPSQTPSATQIIPSPTATFESTTGTTLYQVNIRSGAGSYYDLLGTVDKGRSIPVIARDIASTWLAIQYPEGSGKIGWTVAQYIQVSNLDKLPVLSQVYLSTGTPAPEGTTSQKLNVRSGPGASFDSLGIIPSGSPVWLMGRNTSSDWYLIDFPKGPGGKGWVLAGYVQGNITGDLPPYDSNGSLISTTTSTPAVAGLPSSTPTFQPAPEDNDSLAHPAVLVSFSPLTTGSFTYSSALSDPSGNGEDWLAFVPYAPNAGDESPIYVSLTCSGNGSVSVQLYQVETQLTGWGSLACGDKDFPINLIGSTRYTFHIEIKPASSPSSVNYTLTVRNSP